jgi:hypothetical protein
MIKLSFLSSSDGTPLTKTARLVDGKVVFSQYPRVYAVNSHTVEIDDTSTEQFYQAICEQAALGRCLIKGTLNRELVNESRQGATDPFTPTQWICLDFDGVPEVNSFADLLPHFPPEFHNTSFIEQFSCSAGMVPEKGYSAHVFILLDKPQLPALLKEWLTHLNLTIPILRKNIRLNKGGFALRYPLDITACQNDKLLYIAPPLLEGNITDQVRGKRIHIIQREVSNAIH